MNFFAQLENFKEPVNLKDTHHLLVILGTLVIFLAIPLTVTLVQQSREPKSRAETIPNDPLFLRTNELDQWSLRKIRAPEAWDITTGSRSIKVAIVSDGVWADHEDLKDNLIAGYAVPGTNLDMQVSTIGAGIIGAVGNNSLGIAGINWQVSMMPVRALDTSGGTCRLEAFVEGIRWAVDNGAQIIQSDLYFCENELNPDPSLKAAFDYALDRGVIVVAPYDAPSWPVRYPADYPGVIGVGSTDQDDVVTFFSATGPGLDLVAPGYIILSTVPAANLYAGTAGNSVAVSHVAGVLALLLAREVSPKNAVQAIYNGALDLGTPGRDDTYGYGRVDACGALNAAGFICPATAGDTLSPTVNITNPTGGQIISGTVNVNVNATDN